jgi:hypothetical protein
MNCVATTVQSLARFSERPGVVERVRATGLEAGAARAWGPALVFGRLWETQGMPELLRARARDRRFEFDVERACFALALQRLCAPGSDLQGAAWVRARHPHAGRDILFSIGSSLCPNRFSHAIPNADRKTIIQCTVDTLDINRSYETRHAVIGDAKLTPSRPSSTSCDGRFKSVVISLCRFVYRPTMQAAASSREVHDDEASTRVAYDRPKGAKVLQRIPLGLRSEALGQPVTGRRQPHARWDGPVAGDAERRRR